MPVVLGQILALVSRLNLCSILMFIATAASSGARSELLAPHLSVPPQLSPQRLLDILELSDLRKLALDLIEQLLPRSGLDILRALLLKAANVKRYLLIVHDGIHFPVRFPLLYFLVLFELIDQSLRA